MDHILYWNQVALEANKRDFSNAPGTNSPSPEQGGPTLSSRALAIVHLAMYDAHAGAKNDSCNFPRYLSTPTTPPGPINAAAAVAAAAHSCLSKLYPSQKSHFDTAHREAVIDGTGGVAEGHAFGLAVAQAMLEDRKNDPDAKDDGYAASTRPYAHRTDPVNPEQGFHAPFYGARSKCFAVTCRYELDAPPNKDNCKDEYKKALQQVRSKGIKPELMGTLPSKADKRTPDDTLIGLYWAYDGPNEIGTPPRLYNQILREIVKKKCNCVDDNAKLFAMVNAAMGDAGILAWEQKYKHDLWRPVLGIREHDPSMGPAAPTPTHDIDKDCDPEWLPLGAPASNSTKSNFTPPFPAYPSGHATFGAAAFQVIRLWYGVSPDDKGQDNVWHGPFVSDELNGVTTDNTGVVRSRHVRKFPRGLWQMIEENGWSRIYLGVHWSFDAFALDAAGKEPDLSKNIGGVPLGLNIANDIYTSWKQGGNISCRAAKKRDATAPDIACDCVDKQ